MEGYLLAIDEQEIVTKATAQRRERSNNMETNGLCKKGEETLNHILASCEEVSSTLYLTYRHNRMGKVIYDEILKAEGEKKTPWNVPEVARIGDKELWWDKKFVLPNKVKHKPDLVIWNRQTKECKIIDFSTILDQNVSMKETEKVNSASCQQTAATLPWLQIRNYTNCHRDAWSSTKVS